MKKLIGWLMVTTFCVAPRLVWADPAGGANKVNPQFLPPGQKQKVLSSHTGKVIPGPKMNGPKDVKNTRKTVKKGGKEVVVNFTEGDPDKPIVTGKGDKDKSPNAGGKAIPKINGLRDVKDTQNIKTNARTNEEAGIYYYFKHNDSGHSLVTGKAGNDGSLNTGGKAIPKMNGHKDGKYTQKTVKEGGKEVLVNYISGDPDKPIVTGQANNRAVTTGGRQSNLNEKSAKGPGL
jgi:hypothetical protein